MLAHNVSAEIRRAISRGEFAPGQKLNEVALAERFGVSRNTLREAFAMLTSEGLCERIPNRGVFLATPSPEFVTDTFRARAAIEPAALLWGPDLDVDRGSPAQGNHPAALNGGEGLPSFDVAKIRFPLNEENLRNVASLNLLN